MDKLILESLITGGAGLLGASFVALVNHSVTKKTLASAKTLSERANELQKYINDKLHKENFAYTLLYQNRLNAILELHEKMTKFLINLNSFQQESYYGYKIFPLNPTANDLTNMLHEFVQTYLKFSFYMTLAKSSEFDEAFYKFHEISHYFLKDLAIQIEKNEYNIRDKTEYSSAMREFMNYINEQSSNLTDILHKMILSNIPREIKKSTDTNYEKLNEELEDFKIKSKLYQLYISLKNHQENSY